MNDEVAERAKKILNTIHVIPTNDIKEHEESISCWCVPRRDVEEPSVVIHNAFAEAYGDERDLC